MPRRGRPDGEGGASNGIDNASYDSNDDIDNSNHYPASVHSYSTNRSYDKRRTSKGVYGVARTPQLEVGHKRTQNPPSYPNPPIDARVNVVNHSTKYPQAESTPRHANHSPKSSRSQISQNKTVQDSAQDKDRSRKKTPKNSGKKSSAMEMADYSNAPRKTLAEQAREAGDRPSSQVRGYRSTNKVSGYLETPMNDSRAGSAMSDRRSGNLNSSNNKNHRSKPSKAY